MLTETLYEKLGGEPAIDATVDAFYKLVLADPLLSPFFAKTNMVRQRKMQKAFLNHVFGGGPYNGKNMRKAHAGLHLTDEHFNRVAECLAEAMLSLGVTQDLVDEVIKVVATTREDVLGLPGGSQHHGRKALLAAFDVTKMTTIGAACLVGVAFSVFMYKRIL